MEPQDGNDVSSSSRIDPGSFTSSSSSFYSPISSISSSSQRYPSTSRSFRPRSEASAQQSISDLKSLLDILFTNQIPGPKLIRLEREFCTSIGHGGQANVYGVSPDFEKKALALQNQTDDQRIKHSALYWTKCVVKHLRTDQRRNDVLHAFREISRLCAPSLKSHPNIVKMVSWGLSLDALEAVNLDSLSTPLLILEKARFDLAQLIQSPEYETLSYETLCHLSLNIGHGLGAVHSSGIVHGDLKLENILIFSESQATGMEWTAKLCDFGSAVSISAAANARDSATYLGNETWLPPECYAKSFFGEPLPQSLAPCDIFVYGLVVWAMFIGIHFSPLYKIQTAGGHGAAIAGRIGQQWFYARAKDSVAASFSPAYSDVLQLLAAFTDQTFSHFGGGAERQALERRQQRRHRARSLGHARVSSDEISEEDKISRILSVLRASLNDSPDRRDLQPWRYLDYKRYPFVPRVENLPRYTPHYIKDTAAREENSTAANRSTDSRGVVLNTLHRFATYSLTNKLFSWSLEIARAKIKQTSTQIARGSIRSTIQLLNQPQHRQKTYEEYLRFTIEGTPGLRDIDLSGFLGHPLGGEHYTLDSSLGEMRPWVLARAGAQPPSGTDQDLLYSWARLRSHFKWCCWQEYSVDEQSVVQQYLRHQPEADISTLAWLCRGVVGQREVQCLNGSQLPIWGFGASKLKSSYADSTKTSAFLLLFERGFQIHSTVVVEWGECTQFRWFLQTLKQPEHALDVAAHFQRIAREDATPPRERYYLTGRTADVDTEEDHEALLNTHTTTTALHDAVGAANYPLVEYLVANAFSVSAKNSNRQTALECMPVHLSMSDAGSIRAADVNSIRALLEQSQSKPRRAKSISALPLGWEEFVYTDGRWWKDPNDVWRRASENNALRAWQETSIEGGFDAISFIAPKTGLYQSDRLVLGRIQGEKKVYRLDLFRFLKKRNDKVVARMSATKPVFDEDWYRADIQALEIPLPFRPMHDARAWIRYPAKALQFAWKRCPTLVLAVFSLLSLVARLKRWPQLELIFAVVAVSLFPFGFSPAGIWIGVIPESYYDSPWDARVIPESSYGSNVWSNAPELFVSRPSSLVGPDTVLGISAVARGETKLAKSSLIGFILCDFLWVFGVTLFKLGIQHRQVYADNVVSVMNGLCLEASALVSILVWFDITIGETEQLPLSPDKTMILSRSIAIVSFLLWACFLAFRNYTHTHLFEEHDSITPSDSDDHSSSHSASLSLVENLIQALIRLVLLGLCADNVVHSLLFQPILARSICTYFAIPLTARVWAQYRGVHSGSYFSREMVDSSIGAAFNSLLFVAPCLVVLGGIIGSPMDLRFSVMEIILVDIAVWTLSVVGALGIFDYFRGALLMSLYVMSALSLYLTL
ncbi:MAG: hypothetical protein Q9172_005331 [Xanthocarpia lactea]